MAAQGVKIRGLREFKRAASRAERVSQRKVNAALRKVGEVVRREWSVRFSRVDERSASTYRVAVRQRGVFVGQQRRKTTGRHPEYGRLQQWYGMRVLRDKEREVERATEVALDQIADVFERT